ncbi:hypothetical protein AB9H29_12100 [Stenotrophomonas sepilia]|uniref:hypothetical protein n=1 Tax=Stenotrophomonas sepilia TaxID=2860290 RepID=UPI00355792B1
MNLEPIDTSTTAGKAEVMRLAAEGRRVAFRRGASERWYESEHSVWNWSTYEYAIISEPVGPEEVWAKVDVGSFYVGTTKGVVESWVKHHGGAAVRYIRADLAGEKG